MIGSSARVSDSLAILDFSEKALEATKKRLGRRGGQVNWLVADLATWAPADVYDLWHDRAAFHFLTNPADRDACIGSLRKVVRLGGHVIIATFALDGPETCSGLPIVRYDSASLASALGPELVLIDSRRHDHLTPSGSMQRF